MKKEDYALSMKLDLTSLTNVPEGRGPTFVFMLMIVQMVQAWGDQNVGGDMKQQKVFHRIREKIDQAMTVKEEVIVLNKEEFDFLDKCSNEAKLSFAANEALIRVRRLIEEAAKEQKERANG